MAREKSVPAISAAELEVIKTLWDRGAMAARDVFAALPDGHGWAYKTVKTLLARLVAKGAVAYEQVGNSYLYRPAVSREQVTRRELKGLSSRSGRLAHADPEFHRRAPRFPTTKCAIERIVKKRRQK